MRLTRLYLKRFSKLRLLILGCLLGIFIGYFFIQHPQKEILETQVVNQLEINKLKIKSFTSFAPAYKILEMASEQ
ncbi:hypothetical protein [Arsenophonus sp. PmNCSU2021_1]|uniref:hypothetical protein n=1 Tax=Arsenophonus sp. PmNCSU2021_1 TaxID=3118989 RepID=UPI002FF2446F